MRYQKENPGDTVHVDVKKLGRIPDGGGHRTLGRAAGNRVKKTSRPGHAFLHSAIEDHKKETTAGFWERACAFHASHGITVTRVKSPIDRIHNVNGNNT